MQEDTCEQTLTIQGYPENAPIHDCNDCTAVRVFPHLRGHGLLQAGQYPRKLRIL